MDTGHLAPLRLFVVLIPVNRLFEAILSPPTLVATGSSRRRKRLSAIFRINQAKHDALRS